MVIFYTFIINPYSYVKRGYYGKFNYFKEVILLRLINKLLILVLSMVLLSTLVGCSQNKTKEFRKDIFALNTYIGLTIYTEGKGNEMLDKAIARLNEIEDRMSVTIETSDVSLINKNAGIEPTSVHEDTFYVIQKAMEYSYATQGAFDISIYPIINLWGVTLKEPIVPSDEQIKNIIGLVNYQDILLDEANKTVFLKREGMKIDLGGVAKGYAADEVARVLKEEGVVSGVIDLGGDIVTIGNKLDGTPWRIGLRDPRGSNLYQHFAIVEVTDHSIVTSGDYERYMEGENGDEEYMYHHIFDPKTGYPTTTNIISATVMGASAIETDILSTTLFILGVERGLALIDNLADIEALIVTKDKNVYKSQGWDDILKITNNDYTIIN